MASINALLEERFVLLLLHCWAIGNSVLLAVSVKMDVARWSILVMASTNVLQAAHQVDVSLERLLRAQQSRPPQPSFQRHHQQPLRLLRHQNQPRPLQPQANRQQRFQAQLQRLISILICTESCQTSTTAATCTATPFVVNTFDRLSPNNLGGDTGTGGTGSFSVSVGVGTWRPLSGGYFYTKLSPQSNLEANQCISLTQYSALRVIMQRKDSTAATIVTIGIDLGCETKVFKQLANAQVDGINRAFKVPLKGIDLTRVKAVVLIWNGTTRPTIALDTFDFRCF
ncbi:hypothetical protein HK098_005315 [Nowakowskiella sp. JEL0407]|nr:hypothetical protein HK098_005315 [Nowakowskiella sp. JEL0407]